MIIVHRVRATRIVSDLDSLLMVGRTLGHYRVEAQLGAGGMGEVYLARDNRLGRRVALKFLPGELTDRVEWVQRLKQEARAASALNHPNIVTVHEIGRAGGRDFIASEFIEGETLRQRLEGGPLPLHEALDIAMQVAAALAAAHEAGIVHRDIKPENIMIRRDGYVKVVDFGVATSMAAAAGNADAPTETVGGAVKGTLRYMSPEQLSGHRVDARTDIFSVGVVIFEMVAGRRPFDGAGSVEVTMAILNQEPPPLARYVRVPAELERIVKKTIHKSPDQRYQVIKDLFLDLRSLKLECELNERVRAMDRQPAPRDGEDNEQSRPAPPRPPEISRVSTLEPPGGAVPLKSPYYLERPSDAAFAAAIARRDSIVLVKGARQVGKTSLLARGLQLARRDGSRVVLSDFQKLNAAQLATPDALYLALAQMIADQLELDVLPDAVWDDRRGPSINFERFVKREVLRKLPTSMVWGLDEVDRLFGCTFGSEVFGLFRSWHNERSLDPEGPWQQLTLAIAYATEAHLFITDMNQSPFNVGTRLHLDDFSFEQVAELNRRYDSPLVTNVDLRRFYGLVGGQPYLVRSGLHSLVTSGMPLGALEAAALTDASPFGDHLRRMMASLAQEPTLSEAVRSVIQGRPCPTEVFYRLRSAGLVAGDSAADARLRCGLYKTYLERHLT